MSVHWWIVVIEAEKHLRLNGSLLLFNLKFYIVDSTEKKYIVLEKIVKSNYGIQAIILKSNGN